MPASGPLTEAASAGPMTPPDHVGLLDKNMLPRDMRAQLRRHLASKSFRAIIVSRQGLRSIPGSMRRGELVTSTLKKDTKSKMPI